MDGTSVLPRTAGREEALVRVQAIAGGLFSVFLLLHMGNTLLGMAGPEIYNGVQRVIRRFYQHPVGELGLVFLPLIAHAVAGVWLHALRKKQERSAGLRYRLHRWAGVFLLLVVFGHIAATRGVSYWFGVIPEFGGVSFTLWWSPQMFYPYYFLLFMAGFYHATVGLSLVSRRSGLVNTPVSGKPPTLLMLVGAVGITLALLGFGGRLFDIDDPRDNDYARLYGQWLDIDLSGPPR